MSRKRESRLISDNGGYWSPKGAFTFVGYVLIFVIIINILSNGNFLKNLSDSNNNARYIIRADGTRIYGSYNSYDDDIEKYVKGVKKDDTLRNISSRDYISDAAASDLYYMTVDTLNKYFTVQASYDEFTYSREDNKFMVKCKAHINKCSTTCKVWFEYDYSSQITDVKGVEIAFKQRENIS